MVPKRRGTRFESGRRSPTWPSSNLSGRRKRAFSTIAVVLLTLRVPVVDLRPFCRPDYPQGVRLPATWSEDEDFVRYFGPVTKRLRGPVDPWASERAFCRYDRVLRFPPSYPALLSHAYSGSSVLWDKRRLYPATTRNDLFHVDLQFAGRSGVFLSEQVHRFADIVRRKSIWSHSLTPFSACRRRTVGLGASIEQPVGRLGPPIAGPSTPPRRSGARAERLFLALLLSQSKSRNETIIGDMGGEWELGEGLRLAARTVVFDRRTINVFVVMRPRQVDRYRARALRIHLLRLHAEREYLRRLARLLAIEGSSTDAIRRRWSACRMR